MRHDLLESSFDSFGIACTCHPTLNQFCVVELGLNVVAKQPIHEHPEIRNGLFYEEIQLQAAKIQKEKLGQQNS